jgi:hypothetical protein
LVHEAVTFLTYAEGAILPTRVGSVKISYPKLQRRPELDALRGLFLVWMTLTHLPTHFSDFVNQPFGFVSSAEGFVFLSAMLVSRVYMRDAQQDESGLRAKLWRRTLKIYGYHLLMLTFAFTVAAAFAATTHRPALSNLLNFYLVHPVVAIIGSVLLIYCPPLLDILPMYVLFLFFTPMLLTASARYGWRRILAASFVVWVGAQFGLRELLHGAVVHVTHLPIPLQETGAFNLFAWQGVWIAGLWLGAKSVEGGSPLARVPGYVVAICGAVCAFFLGVRHEWLGAHLTQQSLGMSLDKWSIGPMRLVNLIAFTIVCYWMRRYLVKLVSIEPFLTLGKASLQVFCAHVFFVFVGLALLYEDVPQLHGRRAYGILLLTFAGLIWVAVREVRLRRAGRVAAGATSKSSSVVS